MVNKLSETKLSITIHMDLVKTLHGIQAEFLAKGERINYDHALRVLLKRCGCAKYLETLKDE